MFQNISCVSLLTFCYFATSISSEHDANRGFWSILNSSSQNITFENGSLRTCDDRNIAYANPDNPSCVERMSYDQIRAYLHLLQERHDRLQKRLMFAASRKLTSMAHVKDRVVQNMTSRLMRWCVSKQHVCEIVLPPVIACIMHGIRRSNRFAYITLRDGDAKRQ